jgi:hypothetical protein
MVLEFSVAYSVNFGCKCPTYRLPYAAGSIKNWPYGNNYVKITKLVLIPTEDKYMYIFLCIYCYCEIKWQIPVRSDKLLCFGLIGLYISFIQIIHVPKKPYFKGRKNLPTEYLHIISPREMSGWKMLSSPQRGKFYVPPLYSLWLNWNWVWKCVYAN